MAQSRKQSTEWSASKGSSQIGQKLCFNKMKYVYCFKHEILYTLIDYSAVANYPLDIVIQYNSLLVNSFILISKN